MESWRSIRICLKRVGEKNLAWADRRRAVCVDEGMGGDPSPYLACQWAVAAFECGEQRLRVQNALDFFAGGLAEEVDDKVLHAAFIPFGDITDIQIPLDYETGGSFGCL